MTDLPPIVIAGYVSGGFVGIVIGIWLDRMLERHIDPKIRAFVERMKHD